VQFNRETRRLLIALLSGFALVAIVTAYWAITGADTIFLRDDNARLFEAEAAIIRGNIYDRNGEILAQTIVAPQGTISRIYHNPSTFGITGYYSLTYGVGSAESAFDTILRGDDLDDGLSTYFQQEILHLPQRGSDIRLTIDVNLQDYLYEALANHTGAAIVLSIPDGQIHAIVTRPTYDPNLLDEEWDNFVASPGNLFFNRALQAQYQPGSLFQIPIMTVVRPNNFALNTPFENASQPVNLSTITLECDIPTDIGTTLTLEEAFIRGCPAPFLRIVNQIGEQRINALLNNFSFLDEPPVLDFITELPESSSIDMGSSVEGENVETNNRQWIENALGQGNTTLTLLDAARIIAAIVNDGNAMQPYALQAYRLPETSTWMDAEYNLTTYPVMTVDAARELRMLMRTTLSSSLFGQEVPSELNIGGKITTALSGDRTLTWFLGFATTDDQNGYIIALIIETPITVENIAQTATIALSMAASTD
jgi:peptidoglycan glycosyltransferase